MTYLTAHHLQSSRYLSRLSTRSQRLVEICDDIVNVLGASGYADIVACYAGSNLFFGIELLMCRAGRVYHQCLAVANIGQMAGQLDAVDKLDARFPAAFDTEAEDGALTIGQIFLGQCVISMRFEPGVVHPVDLRLLLEPLRQRQRILRVPCHAQVQRLDPLQEQEGIERGHAATHIAALMM